ncbi:MAG: hypothetical protein FWG98_05930 [Candidatus Cloacimonetes bacterium]|nr:hypothetical protein [Candidatus Cloacimonadota bacterium]
MNKIKPKVCREMNYVFHILSVSKCGYDNEYGKKYMHLHLPEDLKILKDNEFLLTIKGGEHIGALYGLILWAATKPDTEAKDVYMFLNQLFDTGDIDFISWKYYNILTGDKDNLVENDDDLKALISESDLSDLKDGLRASYHNQLQYKSQIVAITDVMIRNYDIFINKVWDESKETLLIYANTIQDIFETDDITHKLENIVGVSLESDFIPSFVNSIDDGAEALDMHPEVIFGIGRDFNKAKLFIAHEYVILLLKNALKNTPAFSSEIFTYYDNIEALAEFYLEQVTDEKGILWKSLNHLKDFYEKRYNENSNITASELFIKAVENYSIE